MQNVAKMWLEGSGENDKANGVLFIKIAESPPFQFPAAGPTMENRSTAIVQEIINDLDGDPFQGIEVAGHKWFGGIKKIHAELWKCGQDGKAKREGEVMVCDFNHLQPSSGTSD